MLNWIFVPKQKIRAHIKGGKLWNALKEFKTAWPNFALWYIFWESQVLRRSAKRFGRKFCRLAHAFCTFCSVKGLGSNTGFLRQKIEKEPFFSLNVWKTHCRISTVSRISTVGDIGCIVDGFWFDITIVSPYILKVAAIMLLFWNRSLKWKQGASASQSRG